MGFNQTNSEAIAQYLMSITNLLNVSMRKERKWSNDEFLILIWLDANGESTISKMNKALRMTGCRLSKITKALLVKGLIRKWRRDKTSLICLTPEAIETIKAYYRTKITEIGPYLTDITEGEMTLQILAKILGSVSRIVGIAL